MNKKELKREYKEALQPMGVLQIRNALNDKVFIGSTMNLKGVFNKNRFQLNAGNHPSRSLQKDWNESDADKFEFEILEEIFPRKIPDYDYKADLEVLEDLWLEKLEPYGEKGYNERKKTRVERLRMIAANRKL